MRQIKRSEAEIDEALNLAAESIEHGKSKWPGMTYEQGIEDALLWLFGETEDHPMKDQ